MKALKVILAIVVLLVAAAFIASLAAPTEMVVERTVEINAPAATIHPYVSHLEKSHSWSPWAELDPEQKVEYIGKDGTVGAVMKWEGNADVGKGEQEITAITPNRVDSKLRFKEPYEGESDAYVILEETDAKNTKVTWGFKSEMGRPMNLMMLFGDMDATLGADFQKGLDNLKDMVESSTPNNIYGGYQINEVEYPETFFVMISDSVSFADMESFFGNSFGKLYGDITAAGKQPGVPSGLYFTWDTTNQTSLMAAAIPVTPAEQVGSYDTITLSGEALQIDYRGPYDQMEAAHLAMEEYINANGLQMNGPALEQYITDPQTEPDSSRWLTQIIYFVE